MNFWTLSCLGGRLWPLFFGGIALLSGIIASLISYATYNLRGNFYTLVEEAKGYLAALSLYLIYLVF